MFTQVVKLTLEQCESTAGLNLMTGFRKCGIYSLSRRVLHILPTIETVFVVGQTVNIGRRLGNLT